MSELHTSTYMSRRNTSFAVSFQVVLSLYIYFGCAISLAIWHTLLFSHCSTTIQTRSRYTRTISVLYYCENKDNLSVARRLYVLARTKRMDCVGLLQNILIFAFLEIKLGTRHKVRRKIIGQVAY